MIELTGHQTMELKATHGGVPAGAEVTVNQAGRGDDGANRWRMKPLGVADLGLDWLLTREEVERLRRHRKLPTRMVDLLGLVCYLLEQGGRPATFDDRQDHSDSRERSWADLTLTVEEVARVSFRAEWKKGHESWWAQYPQHKWLCRGLRSTEAAARRLADAVVANLDAEAERTRKTTEDRAVLREAERRVAACRESGVGASCDSWRTDGFITVSVTPHKSWCLPYEKVTDALIADLRREKEDFLSRLREVERTHEIGG